MEADFNLERYLSEGIENIIKDILRASLTNPKASIYFSRFAVSARRANGIRKLAADRGEHIPPFLIASITSKCNLNCRGCYSKHNNSCGSTEHEGQISPEKWLELFKEARDIGICFILLAGGEPLMRHDVIKAAASVRDVLFPIFTNATLIDDDYVDMFEKNRNLIPVLSIEGDREKTDTRRGIGVYDKYAGAVTKLRGSKILYGVSVTVTKANLQEVTSEEFLGGLDRSGCKLVFYVEYVPVSADTIALAFDDTDRGRMREKLIGLRRDFKDTLFVSFPGDESDSGGCLAAGRGFFHINPKGEAEPCPFSPYSDTNVKDATLKEALNSPFFKNLKDSGILSGEHTGGCVLFEREETVRSFLTTKT